MGKKNKRRKRKGAANRRNTVTSAAAPPASASAEPAAPAERRNRRKKKKTKINVLRMSVTVVVVLLALGAVFSIKNIVDLHIEQKELLKTNKDLKEQKAELNNELKHINDSNYIEEQARTQLNMIMPGEKLYIVDDSDDSSKDDN